MHLNALAASLLLSLPVAQAINIISSNDDGWAEINIRTFYDALSSAGHSVVISAPADNKSGSGSLDAPPISRTQSCEFDSCPADSPAVGFNASSPQFNWVNSYPVTSIKYGINTLSPQFFNGPPDLAVAGPNVGANLGMTTMVSGTVGAATYAAHNVGIPAIAFSGSSGSQTAWNTPSVPLYSQIYAELSRNLTDSLIASGTPYLPNDIWLNVNFPEVNDTSCNRADDFGFVLSRIYDAVPGVTPDDVETCGNRRLPTESTVVGTPGCYVSVSVGTAGDKQDANSTIQGVISNKLSRMLICLS
ncbi:hypothetical protein VTN00DRAFT_2 [Thermoascus crustaceus]|uniref:uncharacterized protein n=1 Tax=Thermoascus crustaceus TaxID=5088 RepID=UPI003743DDF3